MHFSPYFHCLFSNFIFRDRFSQFFEKKRKIDVSQKASILGFPVTGHPHLDPYDVKVVSVFWMGFKFLFGFLPLSLAQIPFILFLWLYISLLQTPCDSPNRESFRFQLYCCLMFVVGFPMLALASISSTLDLLAHYFFSIVHPWAGKHCIISWRPSRSNAGHYARRQQL